MISIPDSFKSIVGQIKRTTSTQYFIAIVVLGLIIRLRQFLINRSLWLDESFLANNIRDRNFQQLLDPLDYSQVAPIGFLWLEKLMTIILGTNELSLRLIPLIVSIFSIYLIYDLSKSFFTEKLALTIALGLTVLPPMIYFSSEVKQYMLDVFSLLFLFWYYFRHIRNSQNQVQFILFGIIGAFLIWISNISIIVLVSIGVAMLVNLLTNFSWKNFLLSAYCAFLWLGSFLIYFTNFINNHIHKKGMESYWAEHFMPHNPLDALVWFGESFFWIFRKTAGHYEVTIAALFFFSIGVYSIVKEKRRIGLFYLLMPLIVHVVLSFFHLYPFGDRLTLYLVPIVLIFEFKGITYLADFTRRKTSTKVLLISILLVFSILRVPINFFSPLYREDIKPVLKYIMETKNEDDRIYIYSGSGSAFKFYRTQFFEDTDTIIIGVSSGDDYDRFVKEFDDLSGRIWIVFSHMNPQSGIDYIENQIKVINNIDYIEADGSKAYLIIK